MLKNIDRLVRICAPYFVAGVVLNEFDQVVQCAPILRKWFKNQNANDVLEQFRRKGHKVEIVE